jgi:hypothetical protein
MDYIDIQDEGTVSYTPVSKLERIKEQGRDPWKTNRVNMKVGKFLNKMFVVEGRVLENLVNQFKTTFYTSKGDYDKIFTVADYMKYRNYYDRGHGINQVFMVKTKKNYNVLPYLDSIRYDNKTLTLSI